MFSENMRTLFRMLSCTNSEIAKASGCSRSYISHILNDNRNLKPSGKGVSRLTEGIYCFAENENMLGVLCQVVQAEDESREVLLPALTAWLFDADRERILSETELPKRRREKVKSAQLLEFGDKLNEVMNLLELSNARLARLINVDDSLVSRWRSGLRSPKSNRPLAERLADALLERSVNMRCETKMAELSGISAKLLEEEQGRELWITWLLGEENPSIVSAMDKFLDSISNLSDMPSVSPEISQISFYTPKQERYWETEGLRQAVIRFLVNAAEQGGELWLYSDESMDWLAGDAAFFAGWKALMAACIQNGVTIKIIHNIDRNMNEMLAAISGWLPLYMSGQIEPFVCRKPKDQRFLHTFFLRPDAECIYGGGVNGVSDRWYDYITDSRRLSALKGEYGALLSYAEPLVKVYTGKEQSALFRQRCLSEGKNIYSILSGLSLPTLPEKTLTELLSRAAGDLGLDAKTREEILAARRKRYQEMRNCLSGQIYEFVVLPSDAALFQGEVRVNLNVELIDADLRYTAEEYASHIREVLEILESEKNYHLLILPELPFSEIQILLTDDSVTVIRSKEPFGAFVFTEPYMVRVFREYFDVLKKRYDREHKVVCRMLRRYL